MDDLLPPLAIFGGLAAVLCGFAWLALHVRRRGTAGTGVTAALAAWEEAYRATSHESYLEIQAQAERRSPVVSPDGHWRPGVRDASRKSAPTGRVRVRLRRMGRRRWWRG
ncbi:hypothetical protein GCM10010319_61680 [Streptomyces blastmyceticus]|uniref:Secreted protein n=1 Tax=Streptomyces blastmyceticus TaxID=68180 RepID=A0ABP3HQ48_9ACTN